MLSRDDDGWCIDILDDAAPVWIDRPLRVGRKVIGAALDDRSALDRAAETPVPVRIRVERQRYATPQAKLVSIEALDGEPDTEEPRFELRRLEAPERHAGHQAVNTYNFLPFRKAAAPIDPAEVPHRTARHPNLVSGDIILRLVVRTPVALGGAATQADDATHKATIDGDPERLPVGESGPHTRTELPRDGSGDVYVPGATLKGALRSWYESITGSARPMAPESVSWRATDLVQRAATVPGLLQPKDGGGFEIVPMSSTIVARPAGDQAAYVDTGALNALREEIGEQLLCNGMEWRSGHLHVSASVQGELSVRHLTRTPGANALPVDETTRSIVLAASKHLTHDHRPRERQGRWPDGEGRQAFIPATALDVVDLLEGRRSEPVIVWYLVEGGVFTRLSHVRGGRWASLEPLENTAEARIGAGALARKTDDNDQVGGKLHPADVVLGTSQAGLGADERPIWAGRLRVGVGRAIAGTPTTEYSLPYLASPKPEAAGLYLEPRNAEGLTVSWDMAGMRVRGTKVYWHQTRVEDLGSDVRLRHGRTVEVVMPGDDEEDEEVVFESRIVFEDLTDRQLGEVLLAIGLRFYDEDHSRGWKLGQGKPFGFGSVENRIGQVRVLDEEAAALDPFGSMPYRDLTRDEIESYVAPVRDDLQAGNALVSFEVLARHDTLAGLAEGVVAPVRPRDLRRDAAGRWYSTPDAAGVSRGEAIRRHR